MATILNSFELETTEAVIAEEAYSYAGGTEAWYLARSLRSRGCRVKFCIKQGLPAEDELPAVVGTVVVGGIGHFIPILEKQGDQFVIGDPLHGRELLSEDQLLRRYDFTGFAMIVTQ